MLVFQAGDNSAEMHQKLKDLGVPIPTGPDAVPALPQAPVPLGNIIPAPSMGLGQPYPLMPQITLGPTEFLSVNGMVTADVLVDDAEYREVGKQHNRCTLLHPKSYQQLHTLMKMLTSSTPLCCASSAMCSLVATYQLCEVT